MKRTAVINVVGLTPELLGPHTPNLNAFATRGKLAHIKEVVPAVTCTALATYATGKLPREHGVVGNGWFFRDECEVHFWHRSDRMVGAPKVWEVAKVQDPSFTCANLFWRYATYSSADFTVIERPMYPADGRKLPDIYAWPHALRPALTDALGPFPLFNFWGPNSSIVSSRWIADAARWVEEHHHPTLSLVYLPHLDYELQRVGPDGNNPKVAQDLRDIDTVAGDLLAFYEARGVQPILLSEYGIDHVSKPVHINRLLRERGFIAVREELGLEQLNAGMSRAFAVADHQIAHVYIKDRKDTGEVRALLEALDGVAEVLDEAGKEAYGLDHPRSGELIVLAEPDAWFTYYYWLEDSKAPDFARTVDIHRKPGYDPAELFVNPEIRRPKLKAGRVLMRKKLGFRYLMDLIGLDPTLVGGSHGRRSATPDKGPVFVTGRAELLGREHIDATDVFGLILKHLGLEEPSSAGENRVGVRA